MPTPTKGARLGGGPAHERLMLANLATALFEHGRITTTAAKAKRLRPLAERMITFAKRGDLHARRRVLTVIRDKSVVHTLFTEIGPSLATRPGGYTRTTKIGTRKGDNAPMVVIEIVEPLSAAAEAEAATKRAAKEAGAAAAAAAAAKEAELAAQAEEIKAEGEPDLDNAPAEAEAALAEEVETAAAVADAATSESASESSDDSDLEGAKADQAESASEKSDD